MKAFADEFVTIPVCSISRLDACSDEETADIEAIDSKTDQELMDMSKNVGEMAKMEEKKFDAAVEAIQEQYEKLTAAFNAKVQDIKTEHKFKYLEQIMKKRVIKTYENIDMDIEDDDDDDDEIYDSIRKEL